MTGILHEKGLKVATDGSILVAIYSHYKSEYEGKVITPRGEVIDGTFPNWKAVLPSQESLKTVKLSNLIADALRKIKHAETIAKIDSKQVFVSLSCDNEKMYFRSDYFTKFLTFIRTYPGANMGVRQNNCLYASNNNNLCMLAMFNTDNECVVVDL